MSEQLMGLLPMIIIFAVFYFLLIRPQQKQRKARMEMLDSLKKGDKVVTIGGIFGTISELKEESIKLDAGNNIELKMTRESVGQKIN